MTDLPAFAEYLTVQGKSDSTVQGYLRDVADFLRTSRKQSGRDITKEDLYHWDGAITARKLAANSRRRYRVSVAAFLAWAARQYGIQNPAQDLRRIREIVKDPKVPHPDDLRDLLHALDETDPVQARDGAMIAFMAATGVRVSELIRCTCGDIKTRPVHNDPAKKLVWTVTVSSKPIGKERIINFGNPAASDDVATRHFGLWYIRKIRAIGSWTGAADYPLFSQAIDNRKRISRQTVADRILAAAKIANRPDLNWLHPHSFRHYYGTYNKINGMDMIELRNYMGHAQSTTTERYIHLGEKITAEAAIKYNPLRDVSAKPSLSAATSSDIVELIRHLVKLEA